MESAEVCHSAVAYPAGAERSGHACAPDLGRSQAFLTGLVEGMRCGIVAIDRELRLVMVNEPGRQILGLDGEVRPGTPIARALARHPRLVGLLSESFDLESLPNRAELDLGPGTADCRRIGFTLSLIREPDGTMVGAAIFFKDLTQIEHKEEQERLRDRLAAVGQMAASLAHEIRNPLASIEVSCTLLKRRMPDDAEGRKLLDKVTAEVRRLNRTITSSLEFVRPVASRLAHSGLADVLREAVDVAMERCGRPGIKVALDVADAIPPFLMDRQQLRQVFENLVLNALEAVGEEGHVVVEAEAVPVPGSASVPYRPTSERVDDPWRRYEQLAVVRVADDGPGIPEEDRGRVFFPFFTTKKQGSGVGLPMVKKVVDSHRGVIDVGAAQQGGALFTIRLPMVVPAAAEER